MALIDKLTAIADAVRARTGNTESLYLDDIPTAISGIKSDISLPILTNEGASSDLMHGKELINQYGAKITGTFSIDNELTTQDDLIIQIQNTVNNLPDIGDLKPVLQSKIVIPSESKQIVVADSGYDGLDNVTVNGDDNLIASNIKSGVSIFGVTGSYEGNGGSGGDSNKEPCTLTFYDSFGFPLRLIYTSSDDNKPKMCYMGYYEKTINAYKNDVVILAGTGSASSLESMGVTTVDSNMSYTEYVNDDGILIVEFVLTEDNNTICLSDEEPEEDIPMPD